MAPWKLPLVVAAIAVPIVAAFYLSPGLGLAAGALAAVGIVVVAARQRPHGALGAAVPGVDPLRLLVVTTRPVDDPGTIDEIAIMARPPGDGPGSAEVLVLSPARIGLPRSLGVRRRWGSTGGAEPPGDHGGGPCRRRRGC